MVIVDWCNYVNDYLKKLHFKTLLFNFALN